MAQADFSSQTYLIVDDLVPMRTLLCGMLRSFGAVHLDQARDGSEAIALMENKRYDVILCDYNLGPGKDGQHVLEEARHRALIGNDAIFMMVTGENSREMVMSAVEYVPDIYLAKPFTIQMLKTRLVKLLERKADLTDVYRAMRAGKDDAAIAKLDELLAANPRHRAILLRLKADVCLTANRHDAAMVIYDQVLAELMLDWACLGKGKLLLRKKHYEQARALFNHLLERDPNCIPAYDCLAKTQVTEQSFDAAEQTLKTALRLSPRSLVRQQWLGDLALKNGDGGTAEAAFAQAVGLAKHSVLKHPSLYAGLAKSKSANKKHDEALQVARDIKKTFVGHPEAAIYQASALAVIKRNRGDANGAAAALQAAEKAFAELGGTLSPKLLLEMIKTCSEIGEAGKASRFLQEAIANNHDDHEFLAQILHACHETGLAEEADMAIRQIRSDIVGTNNVGVGLIKEGDFDAAVNLLHEAAEEMPGNKTINLNAAKAWIIKMENWEPSTEGVQTVRRYVARLNKTALDDWRLTDIQLRLERLELQV